jgi:hypothetical protein
MYHTQIKLAFLSLTLAACVADTDTQSNQVTGADAQPAELAAATCQVGAITVENFEVPQGVTCRLTGTNVTGNLFVQRAGTLIADGIAIGGSLQAEGAASVTLADATVNGSVQIKQGQRATLLRTFINADLQLDAMTGALAARSNTIGGNLQAMQNTGGLVIFDNRIDGNLQCKESSPAPTGGSNVVGGTKEDQCASL